MAARKFTVADADFKRLEGQEATIDTANLVDQRHGGPVTIGYGRYGPGATLEETIAVHDTMIVLEGEVSVTSAADTMIAKPGDIVYMPEGEQVTIRAASSGALTAYVTYPHWQEARAPALENERVSSTPT